MQDLNQQAARAVAAIKDLDAVYGRFLEHSKTSSANWRPELGSVATTASGITCYCLGHKVSATPRPVALLGRVMALECDFVTACKGDELSLLRLYLQTDGWFTRDFDGQRRFHQHDDPSVKDQLVLELCAALLASPVFAPAAEHAPRDTPRVVNLGAAVRGAVATRQAPALHT